MPVKWEFVHSYFVNLYLYIILGPLGGASGIRWRYYHAFPCKFGAFLFSKDFWHSLYPWHFSYCLWPSPQTPSLLHRRLRKVQMARIFSPEDSGRDPEGIRRKEFGQSVDLENGWNILKNDVFCSISELANSPEHDEHDGFWKRCASFEFFFSTSDKNWGQMEARKETQSNLRGPYETHKNTRCFVAIPVPHCIPLWSFMRFHYSVTVWRPM